MKKCCFKLLYGIIKRHFILMIFCGLILFPLSTAWTFDTPQRHCELFPDAWMPSLNQVGEYLTEFKIGSQSSQQELNQMSQNLADIRDAQLFIIYIQLMQALDASGQTQLFEEQKRWLGKRNESARAAVVSKEGSLAPLEFSDAFRKITEERLAELQQRLKRSTSTIHNK